MTDRASDRTAVAIGGGTGIPRVLASLRELGHSASAVVTMADDGRSSGLLRRELGVLPPGDARNCLVALADPESARSRAFQYRFPEDGSVSGHAMGNLMIAALAEVTGDFERALSEAGEWLGVQGRVLPSTFEDVRLVGTDTHGRRIEGQATIARSPTPIASVALEPEGPPANEEALRAIAEADLLIVGPGSLFTSVMPNFLVSGVREAMVSSGATRVYLCNVANQRGETVGLDADGHVEALLTHGLADAIDIVVVHDTDAYPVEGGLPVVEGGSASVERIRARGLEVLARDLVDRDDQRHHSPQAIARVLREVA